MLLTNSSLMDKESNSLQSMNLWADSVRKWGLESESKSKIERKHLHHIDISNLMNGNTNSHCSLQTLLLWTKNPIYNKWISGLIRIGNDRIRIKIENWIYLHHRDISNLMNGNTNSHCSLQTLLLWTKNPILLQ